MICNSCGRMNPDGARFCCNCRNQLAGQVQRVQPANMGNQNRYSAGGRTTYAKANVRSAASSAAKKAGKGAAKAGGGFIKKVVTGAIVGFLGVNAINYLGDIDDPGKIIEGITGELTGGGGGGTTGGYNGGSTGGSTGGYTGGNTGGGYEYDDPYDYDEPSSGVFSSNFTPFLSTIPSSEQMSTLVEVYRKNTGKTSGNGNINAGNIPQETLDYWIVAEGQARILELAYETYGDAPNGTIVTKSGEIIDLSKPKQISHIDFPNNNTMTKTEFEKAVRDYALGMGFGDYEEFKNKYDAKYK